MFNNGSYVNVLYPGCVFSNPLPCGCEVLAREMRARYARPKVT